MAIHCQLLCGSKWVINTYGKKSFQQGISLPYSFGVDGCHLYIQRDTSNLMSSTKISVPVRDKLLTACTAKISSIRPKGVAQHAVI